MALSRIAGIPLDVVLDLDLKYVAETTDSSVEKGADYTDNVKAKMPEISFRGIISDTPSGEVANDATRMAKGGTSPSKDALQRFQFIHFAEQPVTLECGFGKFENMVMTSFNPKQTPQNFKSLDATFTFKQLRIVEIQQTVVRVGVPNAGRKQNFGLSLDKLTDGKKILWRKGNPPGLSPATEPKGVIIGQEIVTAVESGETSHFYHADGKTKLNADELDALTKDLNRDTALLTRRGIARAENQVNTNGERIEKAQRMLKYKEEHPGQNVDKAMFGL